jgi:transcriptional regulator
LQGLSAGNDVHGREMAELVKAVNRLTFE